MLAKKNTIFSPILQVITASSLVIAFRTKLHGVTQTQHCSTRSTCRYSTCRHRPATYCPTRSTCRYSTCRHRPAIYTTLPHTQHLAVQHLQTDRPLTQHCPTRSTCRYSTYRQTGHLHNTAPHAAPVGTAPTDRPATYTLPHTQHLLVQHLQTDRPLQFRYFIPAN